MLLILPIGHERGGVRRLPWVTFAIMAVCVAVLVSTRATDRKTAVRTARQLLEARTFFLEHPHVEISDAAKKLLFAGITAEARQALIEGYRGGHPAPRDAGKREKLQEEFERRVAGATRTLDRLSFRRWGLIPAAPAGAAWVTHMFLHGGWIHLLGNLLILYFLGPFVEDVWGRSLFLAFYLAGGLAGALLFVARFPESGAPLIGASGAIAAVMGAFLVRYWKTEIHFFYIVGLLFRGTFSAPAWSMLPVWFGEQLFMAATTGGSPEGGGVAYWAHVGGFAFGVAGAWGIRSLRIEERFIQPALDQRLNRTLVANPLLGEAMDASLRGEGEKAFGFLADGVKEDPANSDLALALVNIAGRQGRMAEAGPCLAGSIRAHLRAGKTEFAVDRWLELCRDVPGMQVDASLLVHLARCLSGMGRREEAVAALRMALLQPAGRMTAATALHIAREARGLDPGVARGAARMVLARDDLLSLERKAAARILAGEDSPRSAV
ncbi:MAG: rhomboid family intramembrane serine protease [Rhodospirillales bacterium]